jgi:hypothetical protein
VRLAGDGDLALLHHLQQRALHLGGRAVDLVGKQQVAEHRAERGGKIAAFLVVDARADEVGGDEVRGELDAAERAAHRARERFHRKRLGEARHAFDQKVALREHRDEHALEEGVLADHHLLHFVEHALHQRGDLPVHFVISP